MAGMQGTIQEKQLILLSTALEEMRKKSILTDVTLISRGVTFRASKVVLAASSKYFLQLFSSSVVQDSFEIPGDHSPQVVNILLKFACTGFIDVSEDDNDLLQQVLTASEQLQFDLITEYCCSLLVDTLNEENYCQHWAVATKFNNADMKINVCKFVANMFHQVHTSEDFVKIPIEFLKMIISQPEIGSQDADLVLKSVLNWVKEESDSRTKALRDLLKSINFEKLSDECLEEACEDDDLEDIFLMKRVMKEISSRSRNLKLQSRCTTPASVVENGGGNFISIQPRENTNGTVSVIDEEVASLAENLSSKFNVTSKARGNQNQSREIQNQTSYNPEVHNQARDIYPRREIQKDDTVMRQSAFTPISRPEYQYPSKSTRVTVPTNDTAIEKPLAKRSFKSDFGMVLTIKVSDDKSLMQWYDVEQNKWSGLSDVEFDQQLPYHAATCLDKNKLYIAGGRNDAWEVQSTLISFDLGTNQWQKLEDMTTGRMHAGATVMNGFIYAVGGDGKLNYRLCDVERYSIADQKWETLQPMNLCRERPTVTSYGGKVYVIGGYTVSPEQWKKREVENEQHASLEFYDPNIDQWMKVSTRLPIGREVGLKVFTSTVIGDKLYAVRSIGQAEGVTLHVYTPKTNYWKEKKIYFDRVGTWSMITSLNSNTLCLVDLTGNVYLYQLDGEMRKISLDPEIGPRITYSIAYTTMP